jgi:hypothetical protein
VRPLLLLASVLVACEGKPIGILADGAPDSSGDTSVEDAVAQKTLPDGRVCSGHDEDRDGFPDECDGCPNIGDPEQVVGTRLGAACQAVAPFHDVRTRLFFDPFTEFGLWQSFGGAGSPLALDADRESLSGGTIFDDHLRFIASPPRATAAAMVATSIVTIREGGGRAGVLLRVSGDPKQFFACEINLSLSVFIASRAPISGCAGGPCKLETLDIGASKAAQAIPADIRRVYGSPIGIRASITAGPTNGTLECRVFDPDPRVARVGLLASEKYVMSVPIEGASWIASGEVGLHAQGVRAQFSSLDVLTAP